jgi:hypothetical protein
VGYKKLSDSLGNFCPEDEVFLDLFMTVGQNCHQSPLLNFSLQFCFGTAEYRIRNIE